MILDREGLIVGTPYKVDNVDFKDTGSQVSDDGGGHDSRTHDDADSNASVPKEKVSPQREPIYL